MNAPEKVSYRIENSVAYITLTKPNQANTLELDMEKDIIIYLHKANYDSNVRAIVIEAEGKFFSGGGPVDQLADLTENVKSKSEEIDECLTYPGAVSMEIRRTEKPVIAAIQNAVAGAAANIVLACDFRIARDDMYLIEAFINIGLSTDGGGAYLLCRLVGAAKATELIMLGSPLTAQEAQQLGLVTKILPKESFKEGVKLFAEKLANGPSQTYKFMKSLVNQAAFSDIEYAMSIETEYQRRAIRSQDAKEGIHAFLEKRTATYIGK